MNESRSKAENLLPAKLESSAWLTLLGLVVLAAAIRIVFENGPLGSDDVVYLNRAIEVSNGIWSSANYNGALRYGFNIPAGFAIYLLGTNLFAANFWPLLCSVGEIVVVYMIAHHIWGRRAAAFASLILILVPLHVGVATRIHADPVVAFFLTLSFVLFYFAEQRQARWLYYLTGLAMGLVFWTKELAVVALFPFFLYPLIWRKLDPRWLYVVAGGLTMLAGHLILMYFISGDPFHAFKVVLGQLTRGFIQGGAPSEDGVWYYFKYLFFDIKHTWLAGIVAGVAVSLLCYRRWRGDKVEPGTGYVWFWLVALVGFLSFMPVSLSPLKFVMKQSNYLTLFLAPIALLAGYQISRFPRTFAVPLLVLTLAGGLFLSALGQQDYHIFTSNSKAVVKLAKTNPDMQLIGSVNNDNIASFYSYLERDPGLASRVHEMADVRNEIRSGRLIQSDITAVYAVRDQQTMRWGANTVVLERVPQCWESVKVLVPTGLGIGVHFLKAILGFMDPLPETIQRRLKPPFERLLQPLPATVYRVDKSDFWCEQNSGSHKKG